MNPLDILGAILGFALTLMVFSYLIGDNPLFRIAVHIFIGVAAGFAGVVVIYSVLWPRLIMPLLSGTREERALALIPMLLGWLLLTKISTRLAGWGNVPVAYLVGVGAAVAIGGAVTGTLFPQVNATINLFNLDVLRSSDGSQGPRLLNSLIILTGAAATLAYFHFGSGASAGENSGIRSVIQGLGQAGQIFIAIALGFLFAGVYSAAMASLVERLTFMVDFVKSALLTLIST